MNERIVRIGVLISGSGSNLQAIIDAVAAGYIPHARIEIVVSSKEDAYGLIRAKKAGIEGMFIDPASCFDSTEYSLKIVQILQDHSVDLVCLAGFMRKLEKPFLVHYAGRIMNIHPALLPKFGGKGMYGRHVHEAVLSAGEKESGPTVHFVDEQYDHGPIILQKKVPVKKNDTPDTLAHRVLEEEHNIYPDAVKMYCEGKLKIVNGKVIIKQ